MLFDNPYAHKRYHPLPKSPDILACHFGRNAEDTTVLQTSNLHLSKRVLDAVCSTDAPVMASSGPSPDKHLVLTVAVTTRGQF